LVEARRRQDRRGGRRAVLGHFAGVRLEGLERGKRCRWSWRGFLIV
jgi:hypothetical protein